MCYYLLSCHSAKFTHTPHLWRWGRGEGFIVYSKCPLRANLYIYPSRFFYENVNLHFYEEEAIPSFGSALVTSQVPRPTWVSRGTWLTGLALHWPLALCIDHISISAGNQGRLWYFSSPSLRILSGWKCTPQEILSESQFMKSDILKLNLRILQSLRTGNLFRK